MRHFNRLKNWLVLVYVACWTFSKRSNSDLHKSAQPDSNQPQADQVIPTDGSIELERKIAAQPSNARVETIEPSRSPVPACQQPALLETVDTVDHRTSSSTDKTVKEATLADDPSTGSAAEVKKLISPDQKPSKISPHAGSPQAFPVQSSKPQGPQAPPAASVKSQGSNVAAAEPQARKYQPGTINDQTAQRLARLLVSEIKLYYKSKTDGEDASEMQNIYDILKEPIEQSRKHYKQRMGREAIETMPDYFHGELVRSLCEGDASRLGPNYPVLDKSA